MKAVLVALVAVALVHLAAPVPPASAAVWTRKAVRVLDYSSPKWDGLVEAMVAEFNAKLPDTAPRLVYRRKPERSCEELSGRVVTGAIIICSTPTASFVGWTQMWGESMAEIQMRIVLNDRMFLNARYASNTVCHELMHAVTGINDKYDGRPNSSCVWGDLPGLGSFDVAYARKVYDGSDPERTQLRRRLNDEGNVGRLGEVRANQGPRARDRAPRQ